MSTQTAHSSDAAPSARVSQVPFNALGFNGGDLAYSMTETTRLSNVINSTLIYSVTLLVQKIANMREAVQEAERVAEQPIIDQINAMAKGDISTDQSYTLQALTTQYNDTSTKFQQQQTTYGGLQDAETQSVSSISSSVENFISFLQKLVGILQQTSTLM